MSNKKAIVLSSGGLDSTTVMGIAQSQGYQCYSLSLNYGQRHSTELNAAAIIANKMNVVEHKIITLNLESIGGSALTDSSIDVPDANNVNRDGGSEIPVTYVPARNTIFLSIALGYAEVVGAQAIFTGVNAVDYSGYPDCRPEYIEAFANLAQLATKAGVEQNAIEIIAPLLYDSKADIIRKGVELGVDYSQTVSCYKANQWGEACGQCDSCFLRQQGFANIGIEDPTRYYR